MWFGGSWCKVIYRAEPIIQTHFPLSADPLYKRWSFIRNLKQLAHLGNLGDARNFSINISLQTGSAGCCISVLFPLCCMLAICLNENCPCVSSRSEQGVRSLQKRPNGSFLDLFNFLLLLSWLPFIGLSSIFLAIIPYEAICIPLPFHQPIYSHDILENQTKLFSTSRKLTSQALEVGGFVMVVIYLCCL